MEYTPKSWMGTALSLWTRQANTAAKWQCSTGRHRISRWRTSSSLGPTLSVSSWRRGSGGGTSWGVTNPPTTPRRYRMLSPRSRSSPGEPHCWCWDTSALSCWIRREIGGERASRRHWRRISWKICWCTSSKSGAHGDGTGGRGE